MLSRKSFTNLQALASGDFGGSLGELQGGGPLSHTTKASKGSRASIDSDSGKKSQRYGAARPSRDFGICDSEHFTGNA